MRKATFLAKQWISSPRSMARYRELLRNEELSGIELEELNWRKRKLIVKHAFENSAFYRAKYTASGFEPGDLKTPSDFDQLPILEKKEIREHAADLLCSGYDATSLNTATTGGSTGPPLTIPIDPAAPMAEISWRMLRWWGTHISESSAYLYRAVPERSRQVLQKMLLWPTRRNWIKALEMDEGQMERFYRQLCVDRPAYLIGYVGAVDVFAGFLERKGLQLEGLQAIWTTAAPLAEGKRQYLQKVYNAPVYTQYGSCEFYWIAAECRKQEGMHIANDIRHVDVVDNARPVPEGDFGDLVVTDLCNRAFPLIRYRLGDRGRVLEKPCDCGLPFPMMDYVDGRITDKVYLPDGTAVAGETLAGIFRGFPDSIKSYQIRQRSDYSILIRYEALEGGNCDEAIAAVEQRLEKLLHGLVEVRFEAGPVEVNDNGKTRFLISDLEK